MNPLTNFDIVQFIEIMVELTLITHFIRYIISFFFPHEFIDYFDNYARCIRQQSIGYAERYFPNNKNFEVILLTRFYIPLLFMLTVNTYLDYMLNTFVYGLYLFLGYLFYCLKLFFFLNIAPNLDDLELLYDSEGVSKIVFSLKILFVLVFYSDLTPLTIAFLLVFPLSDFITPMRYSNESISIPNKGHTTWEIR